FPYTTLFRSKGPDGLMSTCWPRLSSVDTASGPRILDLPLSPRSSTSRTRSRQATKPPNTIAQSSIRRGSLAVLDSLRLLPRILNDTANGRIRFVTLVCTKRRFEAYHND